jgi:putative transposase
MREIYEEERIEAIKRHVEGERSVEIYQSLGKSKPWFMKWWKRYRAGNKEWYKDLPKRPHIIRKKIDGRIETAVESIRKSLMDGTEDSTKYSFVGPESIQFRMEELGYKPSEIPSQSTIKRIIKRKKLRVNTKERYKRVRSKGRYTLLKPEFIDEIHQIDFVGPRHIKGFGSINSIHLKDVVGRQVAGYQYIEKSMDNVMTFLLNYWKFYAIPQYLQVDNGMSFVGDYIRPRSFSRFVRLCLYMGIEVVFIAPAKPWMNGTIEEFNKGFDRLFWKQETFTDLTDIRIKSEFFYARQNKFNERKLRAKDLKSISPKRMLRYDFEIDANNIPLVAGKIHFIRMVKSKGDVSVLNERFHVGGEYIGEYCWATIETKKESLVILYNDEEMVLHEINRFDYEIKETVHDREELF